MPGRLFDLSRPLLRALEPERAHGISLRALEFGLHPKAPTSGDPRLRQSLMGCEWPNPIGIAAGYDKNARVADALLSMGMGFVEIGTVTPLPQDGNPRPRVFRATQSRAVINRLGFNNEGHAAVLTRLRRRAKRSGIVGVNIGANKDSADRVADYVAGIEAFYDVAAYLTINVSSPNTPGLRDLQAPAELTRLLDRVMSARSACIERRARQVPVIVKLAPDIADEDLPEIVACLQRQNVDGICISNTTLTRPGLGGQKAAGEAGGLSGAPLFPLATRMLARTYLLTQGRLPLIGVGGIDSGETAVAKIEAGASLIQLYTGLIFEGPQLIEQIKAAIIATLERDKLENVSDLVGRKAGTWAEESKS